MIHNKAKAASALAWILIAASGVFAEDVQWTDPSGGNWADPTNWSTGNVPSGGDHAILPDLGEPYEVTLNGSVSVGLLTVGAYDATLVIQGNETNNATLNTANGGINHGTIRLESTNNLHNATLQCTTTFTNAADGVIQAGSIWASKTISGHLKNIGLITADASVPSFPIQGIYEAAGGRMVGDAVYVNNSEVRVTADPLDPNESVIQLRRTCTLTTDNLANTVLHVLATNAYNATLQTFGGFANYGVIRLDSNHYQSSATLSVVAGQFVNSDGGGTPGVIDIVYGDGGDRWLNGDLRNNGRINVEAGQTAQFSSGEFTLDDPGTLEGAGGFFASGNTDFIWQGGEILGTAGVSNTRLVIPVGSTGAGTAVIHRSAVLDGTVTPAQVLLIESTDTYNATLSTLLGSTNEGLIRLECTDEGASTLQCTEPFTNDESGIIEAGSHTGSKIITGHLKNVGLVTADGVVAGFPITGTYEAAGGHMVGDNVFVNNADVEVTAEPLDGTETVIQLRRTCTLKSDNLANTVLRVLATSAYNAALRTLSGYHNYGVIRLDSQDYLHSSTLTVATGQFTNAAAGDTSGVIEAVYGDGGDRWLNGELLNEGRIVVDANLVAQFNAGEFTLTEPGTLEGAGEFFVNGSADFVWEGGQIIGTAGVSNTQLTIPVGSTGTGTAVIRRNSTLEGTVTPAQTLLIQATGSFNASLSPLLGSQNDGTIRLEPADDSLSSTFHCAAAFLNAAQGVIEARRGDGGPCYVVSEEDFVNDGVIRAGAGASLQVTGDLVQSDSAALEFEIGGTATYEYGGMDVNGYLVAEGILRVTLVDAFEPIAGDSFDVLTYDSMQGVYACPEIEGLLLTDGLRFAIDRDAVSLGISVHEGDLIPGDMDCNCEVSLEELATLLSNYGSSAGSTYEDGDLDGDGDVDLSDLATLVAHYGETCL